jgi:hypothetical protein
MFLKKQQTHIKKHWCPIKNMRLLHYARNDVVFQGFEGWRGFIFGIPKINPLQPL